MNEQEKNLKTYLNNIPYDQKEVVRDHILRLIRGNQSIACVRTGVAKNMDDSFYCYIEATGFTLIGKQLHQIRILFPHNYPVAPPQFHLLYKAGQYKIENEALLLSNKVISFEKNPANEDFINLRFPFLNIYWRSQKRNVADAYSQVQKCLNNPPLLTQKKVYRQIYPPPQPNQFQKRPLVEQFVLDIQMRTLTLQDKLQVCEKGQRDTDYNISRVDFLKRNIPKLTKSMKAFQQNVANKVDEQQTISEALTFERNCDPLFDIDERQIAKIKIMAMREGLKEGQRRLHKSLETQLPNNTCKFSDYNNAIRRLCERMFETQHNYLNLSD